MMAEMVCGECGATNVAGEDFCGGCGTYLEWESVPTTLEQPDADSATETTPTVETHTSVVERVKAAVGLTDEATRANTPNEPVSKAEAEQAATQTADPEQNAVTAVHPGAAAPKPRRRPVAVPDQPIQHGDLVCGDCGAGNEPTRKFCRRCGHSLAYSEKARIPWWRRLFAKGRRPGPPAGTRPVPQRQRRLPSLTKYVVLLIVLAGLGFLALPWMTKGYDTLLDRINNVEAVRPDTYRASSSAPGHGPHSVRDGDTRSYWAPKAAKDVEGEFIAVGFKQPIRLVRVLVKVGIGTKDATFQSSGWPTTLRVTLFTTNGRVVKELHLADKAEAQEKALASSGVRRVRFEIKDFKQAKPGSPVAIAELEFFRRR